MPTYAYRCDACRHEFEEFQSITAKPIRKCPSCEQPKARRLIGTGGGTGEMDVMTVQLETAARDPAPYERSVAEVLKLKGRVELLSHGSLPNDGKVIDDRRVYD